MRVGRACAPSLGVQRAFSFLPDSTRETHRGQPGEEGPDLHAHRVEPQDGRQASLIQPARFDSTTTTTVCRGSKTVCSWCFIG